tara:strand:- start:87 stop:548 length:462 start_codon:yes stop_codon:yes gene_type:complete
MKDKHLYKRRTDGEYKGYTEDSFYFNSTEQLWCWKQTSTDKIFKAKTINELKQIKDNNYIGKGNYEHKNDASLEKGHTSTEQFAKLTNIGTRDYVSRLLKRTGDKNKRAIFFTQCLNKSKIESEQIIHKRKVWIFKNVDENKIKIFKDLWQKK